MELHTDVETNYAWQFIAICFLAVILALPVVSVFKLSTFHSIKTLKSILSILRTCRYPFTPDQPVQEADWEVYLRETAQQIVEQQTPKR